MTRHRSLLNWSWCVLVLSACGGQAAPASTPAAASPTTPAAKQPVALFNGKDLTGFVQVLDSKWVVENGVLLARQDPNGRREGESWLFTEKDYTDFILTLKFKVTSGGNSGIFLRDPVPRAERLAAADGGPKPWEIGMEVNIQDSPTTDWPTGSVYSIGTAAPHGLDHPGEWNDLKIKVQADQVTVWLNDKLAVDVKQTRTPKGAIGFQRHGTPEYKDKLVELKDISIEEL